LLEERFKVPFHLALFRPLLLLGCEREPVIGLGTLTGVFVFDTMSWWGLAIGVSVLSFGLWAFSRLAVSDPQYIKTWRRVLVFRRSYAAAATPFASKRKWR